MKINKKQMQLLEDNFRVSKCTYSNGAYLWLEDWTDGGVNMFLELDLKNNLIKELDNYIENFDIDEEIEIHRENKEYREAFRISESLKDFESWLNKIKTIRNILEDLK